MWQTSWYLSKTGAPTARVACWKKKSLPGNSELASNPAHQPPRTVPSQNRPPPYPSRTHPDASKNPPCNSPRIFLHQNQNSEPPQPQPWSLRFTEKSYLHYLIAFWGKIKAMQKRHGTWSLPRQRLRKHLGKGPSLNATHPLPQVKWEWEKNSSLSANFWRDMFAIAHWLHLKDYKGCQQIALCKTRRSWRRCWLQSCAAPCLGLGSWFWPIHNLHPRLCIEFLLGPLIHSPNQFP